MKLRVVTPQTLVDINGIDELSHITEEGDMIRIGALIRHDQLARDNIIRQKLPLLAEAASLIADQQVRNRGTVGGSLAHADPTADLPTAFMALNAVMVASSVSSSRSINSADFFRGFFSTALNHDEILREVRVQVPPANSGSAYLKLTKGHNDFAIVSTAVQLTTDKGLCKNPNVVLGGVSSSPAHARGTEDLLSGARLSEELIRKSALKAADGLEPTSDSSNC